MKLYYVTSKTNAAAIAERGFADESWTYPYAGEQTGILLSERPLSKVFEIATVCYEVDISQNLLTPYYWLEKMDSCRVWLVPAELLNTNATARLLSFEDAIKLL